MVRLSDLTGDQLWLFLEQALKIVRPHLNRLPGFKRGEQVAGEVTWFKEGWQLRGVEGGLFCNLQSKKEKGYSSGQASWEAIWMSRDGTLFAAHLYMGVRHKTVVLEPLRLADLVGAGGDTAFLATRVQHLTWRIRDLMQRGAVSAEALVKQRHQADQALTDLMRRCGADPQS